MTTVVSMYSFVLAGLCFLVFLAKLRSRLLTAEGGTGELTSLAVASGAVFVAMLFVAAAARGAIGFAIKSPGNDESLPGADTLRYFPHDRLRRARSRRPPRCRGRDGDDVVADRANRRLRPLARVGRRRSRPRDLLANVALAGVMVIPAMLVWTIATSVALGRGDTALERLARPRGATHCTAPDTGLPPRRA